MKVTNLSIGPEREREKKRDGERSGLLCVAAAAVVCVLIVMSDPND